MKTGIKDIYFRVDANATIASGHLMRCLSIAHAAQKRGLGIYFISADDGTKELVERNGYHSIVLSSDWQDPEKELPRMSDLIASEHISLLFVDSYQVTESYLSALSMQTHVVYLDDLNQFTYPVHYVINYSNYYRKFHYENRYRENQLLLGCEYAPLRECFRGLPLKPVREKVKKILLLSGGSDQYHVLRKLLQALADRFETVAVCGRYNEDYSELQKVYADYDKVRILQAVNNIEDYMREADLVISAAGSTLYELCACGTPTITYTFADNQKDNALSFANAGIMKYIGDARNEDISANAVNAIDELASLEYRQSLSTAMQKLVDGKGAERIIEDIIARENGGC